jgi:DNA-binding transcriptional LysR family regulator
MNARLETAVPMRKAQNRGTLPQPCRAMFDWNDLKYFLALAREGSTLAASRALEVDPSTVQRRITELEKRIGQPLVRREPTGYRLTAFGEALREQAERVAHAVQGFEQQVHAQRDDAVGVVRVTCPEPIVTRLKESGLIDRFHDRHPRLRVEFVMSDRYLDLMKGDADVALRSGDTDDGELVGRKIGDSFWGVFASQAYVQRHGQPAGVDDLGAHALIGFDESMARHRAAQWLARVAPAGRIVARNTSVLGLVNSAKAGLGLAPLPMAIGRAQPELVCVLGPIDELARIWRVLAAPDQRHSARVAAFFDFIVAEVEALKPIFSG